MSSRCFSTLIVGGRGRTTTRRTSTTLLLFGVMVVSVVCLMMSGVLSTTTTPVCNSVEDEGCGVRGYIKEKQHEESLLACAIAKISKAVEFLKLANRTDLAGQIEVREHQIKVKESARLLVASEISILSAKCSNHLGENCDIPIQCYGISADSPAVCSGHGNCISTDVCQCSTSFSGSNCSIMSTINDPILGRKFADGTTATSCLGYRNATYPYTYNGEGSGLYQINIGPTIYTAYCDMESMGGGWTLIMKTSTSSPFVFDHAMWTATSIAPMTFSNITADEDYVSPLFYNLPGRESRLAMSSLEYYNSWSHPYDTARNLIANNGRMSTTQLTSETCAPQTNCGTQPVNKKPLGIWQSLPYDYTSATYFRFGYINAESVDPQSFGTKLRVGFGSDTDSTDTVDGKIGIGIDCISTCASYDGNTHKKGSGYYYYKYYNPNIPVNGVMMGWLWIR